MPSRPVWSGSISFGLVNIPVRLLNAVREDRIAFHMLHDQDKQRLKRKLVCPADGKEVHPEHIVKGYELEKDHYVVVGDEELEACAPKLTKAIEILDFVDLTEIDPVYFDRPYYVMPQPTAGKSYPLLIEAMRKSGKVGIAKFVMHTKEYLAAIRVVDDVLCLETMHFANEVLPASGMKGSHGKVDERELKVAERLIESLATKFRPEKYRDEYKNCVHEMIKRKAKGKEVVESHALEEKKRPARRGDLMAALEASLAKAKGGSSNGSSNGSSHGRRRKSA